MAPTPLHLLTIPREIRNIIYTYLYQDIPFQRNGNVEHDWVSQIWDSCKDEMCLHQGPLLSVLLTHSRLRDEYMEADWFKNLSATIRGVQPATWVDYDFSTSTHPTNRKLAEVAFAHIRNVTMFIDCGNGRGIRDRAQSPAIDLVWSEHGVQYLTKTLAKIAPYLATLRVALHYAPRQFLWQIDEPYEAFTSGHFLRPPPDSLGGLLLVQRAESYRVQCDGVTSSGPRWLHGIVQEACYVYAGALQKPQFWASDELIGEWKLQSYTDVKKNMMLYETVETPKVTPDLDLILSRMRGWREKRGHEEAKAWF